MKAILQVDCAPGGAPAGLTHLLQTAPILLVEDQSVEDGENLFPVGVDALQILPEIGLEVLGAHPFIDHPARNIDVLAEGVDIVSAEEQSIKKSGLPLGGQRVVFFSRCHIS